jgi:hypothetical protein
MPVEFLSNDQVATYGRFVGEPGRAELERFFFLDDVDRDLVTKHRGEHTRLGFALQLGTVRYLGTFLSDPIDVPWCVVDYLAVQLDVRDPSVIKRYAERQMTPYEHTWQIRKVFGYRDFGDERAAGGLREFLDGRAWVHAKGPYALFEQGSREDPAGY